MSAAAAAAAASAADDDDECSSTLQSQCSAPFGSKLTDWMKTVDDRRLKAGRWRRPHALCCPPPQISACGGRSRSLTSTELKMFKRYLHIHLYLP